MHGTARRRTIRVLLETAKPGEAVEATGWIRTSRFSKNVSFLHLYDGSTPRTVQVVLAPDTDPALLERLGTGAAVRVQGAWVASPGSEQSIEIHASSVAVVGECDPATFPLQKKRTSLEHLRTVAHLRPRTNTFQSMYRVRNALAWQVHRFFQERGFLWVHTPVITGIGRGRRGVLPGPDARRPDRLLRTTDLPHGLGPARGRVRGPVSHRCLHLRSHLSGGELQHPAPCGGVLDDRARDGLRHPG